MDLTKRTALAALACALLFGLGSGPVSADGTTVAIFDVDFASPLHTVGSAPTTGSGPTPMATPTTIRRNPVLVVASYGALTNQPMAFPGPGFGDVAFSLAGLTPCPDYRLAMNVVVDQDLRILISSPFVNLIDFQPDGDVELTIRNQATGTQTTTLVATYTPGDGAAHSLVATIDLVADTFELILDGVSVHVSDFGGQTAVTQFRVFGTFAAVDDIVLGPAVQPEIAAKVKVRPRINLRRRGVLPVVLLSTADLDAKDVDTASLRLSDTAGGPDAAPIRTRLRDVDCDGALDLVMKFSMRELVSNGVIVRTTTSLTLRGETLSGTPLSGADDVRVIERKKRRRCWRRGRRR